MMPVIYLIIISFCGGQEFSRCHFGNWIYYGGKDEGHFQKLLFLKRAVPPPLEN
jgi:hypothetical protein